MKLGVFIDIDQVVTQEPINISFARKLGSECEKEYRRIDDEYHKHGMSSEKFNERFIPLFRKHGMNKAMCESIREGIELRPEAEVLLTDKRFDLFFTSSGPSFFIEWLAAKYGIPEQRVRCTRYSFDQDGQLIWNGTANSSDKASFVSLHKQSYSLTIGVGDNIKNDQVFLEHCDIKIIVLPQIASEDSSPFIEAASCYLSVTELKPIIQLVDRLVGSHDTNIRAGKPASVFIGSSGEFGDIAKKYAKILEVKSGFNCVTWHKLGIPGQNFIDILLDNVKRFDYAVMLLSPDDQIEKKGAHSWAPRDNVIMEMGLALAYLGKHRSFGVMIVNQQDVASGSPALPSDLNGMTMSVLFRNAQGRFDDSALEGAVDEVHNAMLRTMH